MVLKMLSLEARGRVRVAKQHEVRALVPDPVALSQAGIADVSVYEGAEWCRLRPPYTERIHDQVQADESRSARYRCEREDD